MARLTAAKRRKLPASAFAGPGRSFPTNDPAHAHAALMDIRYAPASARANIRRRADAELGRSRKKRVRGGVLGK